VCCEPGHIGPPPEWYRDAADQAPPLRRLPSGAALAVMLWQLVLPAREPGPRPVSTEGGHGRAKLHPRWLGEDAEEDWTAALPADPGGLGLAGWLGDTRNYPKETL
jgi:hypothetical protein